LGGGEEFGVAVGAVAGTQEVEETLLADREVGGSCAGVLRLGFASLRMTFRWLLRGGFGYRSEGLECYLEAVDHLAGAASVDGVLGEAMDDGGEGDEDGGAVLDWRNLHAGDLGVDEDAVLAAPGVFDVVVVAVIFAFECGRAATLAAWGLIVVALLVAAEVWNWCRHGVPPWVSILRMIFQINHLPSIEFA